MLAIALTLSLCTGASDCERFTVDQFHGQAARSDCARELPKHSADMAARVRAGGFHHGQLTCDPLKGKKE